MLLSENKKLIIDKLITLLETYPEIRFCQALYGLGIVENIEIIDVYQVKNIPSSTLYTKDHFNDTDAMVIKRINNLKDKNNGE